MMALLAHRSAGLAPFYCNFLASSWNRSHSVAACSAV